MPRPSRLQFGILVSATTLIVCFFGVRAELKTSEASIAAHRLQMQHAQPAAPSTAATPDAQAQNPPPF